MEGPSLCLAKEQLRPFKGQKVLDAEGNTRIGKEKLIGLEVEDIFSWGKHLVFQFDSFAMRVHFMLFGTFEAVVDGNSVTGDYRKPRTPRLRLSFANGYISMFNCSIKFLEDKNVKKSYDFSVDIMSFKWDPRQAYGNLKLKKDEEIADVLLDQTVFAGVGNIIKNEVLSMTRTNPETLVGDIPPAKLRKIIEATHSYSRQFYKWRKRFVLRKHYTIYQKSSCPHCGGKIKKKKTGKRKRWSFYCPVCQKN